MFHFQLTCTKQVAIFTGQADRFTAGGVDEADNLFVDHAAENHLNHVHGCRIGDTHTINEVRFDLQFVE